MCGREAAQSAFAWNFPSPFPWRTDTVGVRGTAFGTARSNFPLIETCQSRALRIPPYGVARGGTKYSGSVVQKDRYLIISVDRYYQMCISIGFDTA